MKPARNQTLSKLVLPLNMNGMQGRMLRVLPPANRPKEILLVYGHHATLERWFGLARELNKFGGVTMPDLPGFGGMEGFYKIGERPTLNNYADYLAAFIKLRYRQRRLVIVAEGFGFMAATRMLMRFPEVARKVDLIVSLAGFTHKDDIVFGDRQARRYKLLSFWLGRRFWGWLPRLYLKMATPKLYKGKKNQPKARLLEATFFPAPLFGQRSLWKQCDLATHMATINEMLRVDNCAKRIKVPAWHVGLSENKLLNENFVEQHLKVAFESCRISDAKNGRRKLFDSSERTAGALIPTALRRRLSSL